MNAKKDIKDKDQKKEEEEKKQVDPIGRDGNPDVDKECPFEGSTNQTSEEASKNPQDISKTQLDISKLVHDKSVITFQEELTLATDTQIAMALSEQSESERAFKATCTDKISKIEKDHQELSEKFASKFYSI